MIWQWLSQKYAGGNGRYDGLAHYVRARVGLFSGELFQGTSIHADGLASTGVSANTLTSTGLSVSDLASTGVHITGLESI